MISGNNNNCFKNRHLLGVRSEEGRNEAQIVVFQ